jgi:hypothetical protein
VKPSTVSGFAGWGDNIYACGWKIPATILHFRSHNSLHLTAASRKNLTVDPLVAT